MAPPPPPAPPRLPPHAPVVEHRVVLRDGSALFAKDLPRLSGNAVVFTDSQNRLVSLRASEVDLRATGAANHLVLQPAAASPPPRR